MRAVVVIDDHPLMRKSLSTLVDAQSDFEVVGTAGHADEAFDVVQSTRPDLLVLDVAMPDMDGIDFAEALREKAPQVQIVLVTMHEDDGTLRRAARLGAEGYVPKSAPAVEVVRALQTVTEGRTYISPRVADRMMTLASGEGNDPFVTLTPREMEVLRMLASGMRTAEIAHELFLARKTVKNHLSNVYTKLGVDSGTQAVSEAYRLGLVSADPTAAVG